MIKKKGKGTAVAKKAAKKRQSGSKKELSASEVRDKISKRVKVRAELLAEKVMDEGEKGQLAPLKYFFEMAKIFPPANDGSEASKDEECLAKTLLDRLKLPHEPAKQEDDDEETVVIPARVESGDERADEVFVDEQSKAFTTGDTEGHGEKA